MARMDRVLDLELEAVIGELDVLVEWPLLGPVRHEQPPRAGGMESATRFVQRKMPARLGLVVGERGLADEEVGVPRQIRQRVARARVAGVREHTRLVRDAEAV